MYLCIVILLVTVSILFTEQLFCYVICNWMLRSFN